MNRFYQLAIGVVLLGSTLTFSACSKKDDPTPEIEMEEPDAVTIVFTKLNEQNQPTGTPVNVEFELGEHNHTHSAAAQLSTRAEDSHDHTVPHIHLDANSSYQMDIQMFRDGQNINEEFLKAGDVHQFFFDAKNEAGTAIKDFISYVYGDKDKNNRSIGLKGTLKVLRTGEADIQVRLSHGLDKTKINSDVWNYPGLTAIGGDTDMDQTFELHVEAD